MRNNLFGKNFVRTPYKETPLNLSLGAQSWNTSQVTDVPTSWSWTTTNNTSWTSTWGTERETLFTTNYDSTLNFTTSWDTYYDTYYRRTTQAYTDYPLIVETTVFYNTYYTTSWTSSINTTLVSDLIESASMSGSFVPGTTSGGMSLDAISFPTVGTYGPWSGSWSGSGAQPDGSTSGSWSLSASGVTLSGTWYIPSEGSNGTFSGTATYPTWSGSYSGTVYANGTLSGSITVTLPGGKETPTSVTTSFSQNTFKSTSRTSIDSLSTSLLTYYDSLWTETTNKETSRPTSWDYSVSTSYTGTTSWDTSQNTFKSTSWLTATGRLTSKTTNWTTEFQTVNPILQPQYGYNETLNILVIGEELTANNISSLNFTGFPNVFEMNSGGEYQPAVSPSVAPLATPMTIPATGGNWTGLLGKKIRQKSSWFGRVNIINITVNTAGSDTRLAAWLPSDNSNTPNPDDYFTYPNNSLFDRIQYVQDKMEENNQRIHAIVFANSFTDIALGTTQSDYYTNLELLRFEMGQIGLEPYWAMIKQTNAGGISSSAPNAGIDDFVASWPDSVKIAANIDTDLINNVDINNGILFATGGEKLADVVADALVAEFS